MLNKSINLKLTLRCNEKCEFCYQKIKNEEELSIDDIQHLLRKIKGFNIKTILLSGGEPLLHKDIYSIIEILRSFSYEVKLSTNGILLNEDALNRLNNAKLSELFISLGDLKNHEVLQRLVNIKSLYNKIENMKVNLGVNIIVTNKNINLINQNIMWLRYLGIKNIFLIPCKRDVEETWFKENYLAVEDYYKLAETIANWKKKKIKIYTDCALTITRKELGGDEIETKKGYICKAGYSSILINNDGKIYPCSRFVFEKYCAGSIKNIESLDKSEGFKKFYHDFPNQYCDLPPCIRY